MFSADLWNLEPTLSCSHILPRFQHFWKGSKENIKKIHPYGDDSEIKPHTEVRIFAMLALKIKFLMFNNNGHHINAGSVGYHPINFLLINNAKSYYSRHRFQNNSSFCSNIDS